MPPYKSSTSEIKSLTGLRGFAALYVVTYHFFIGQAGSNPLTTFLTHGYLAVDLFFVLSGFVMALNYSHMFASGWSRASYLKFLGRRMARIYPLYLVATLAAFLFVVAGWLDYPVNHYPQSAPLGVALLLNISLVQDWGFVQSIDEPGWSISAEMAAYILFPALLIPTVFCKRSLACFCALVSAGILAALCSAPTPPIHMAGYHNPEFPLSIADPWFALPLIRCLPEFVLGILAFRLATSPFGRGMGSSRWICPVICLVTIGLMMHPKTDLAVVLLFPLIVVCLASGSPFPSRILASAPAQFLGRLSYSIYLTHYLFSAVLHWVHGSAHIAGLAHAQTYAAAIGLALTFGIAYLGYKTIEVPGRRWLRGIFEGDRKNRKAPNLADQSAQRGSSA